MARSAVVTGSSSGIGRAIAVRRADAGFWVLLRDIRRDPITGGEPTDDLIRASGAACEYLAADVSGRQDCDRLVTQAVAHAGRLDVLVNNAALAGVHSRPLLGTEDGDFYAIMAVHTPGPFMLSPAGRGPMLTHPGPRLAQGPRLDSPPQHHQLRAPC